VALSCLAIGVLGALGYSHYLGEGKQLEDLQVELSATKANLAKVTQDSQQAKSETDAMSAQIQQLSATKEELKKQVEVLKSAAPAALALPAPNPMTGMAGMIKAATAQRYQTQFLLLKSRLHLTPEQEAAVKAAMDAEGARAEEMAAKMFSGGKIDPQAMAELKNFKSVDQTLNDILTPDQKTAYQQIKTDQKNSAAEMVASSEMNQISPLLQLSDTQKDQVGSALYQVQLDAMNPNWIKNNVTTSATNPLAILDVQAKAKEAALAKILTPDQLATYHQQAQSQLDMQKAMMQKFSPPTPAASAIAPVSASASH
jgi:DNA repair exonuclease SbcCD ATPase subunit